VCLIILFMKRYLRAVLQATFHFANTFSYASMSRRSTSRSLFVIFSNVSKSLSLCCSIKRFDSHRNHYKYWLAAQVRSRVWTVMCCTRHFLYAFSYWLRRINFFWFRGDQAVCRSRNGRMDNSQSPLMQSCQCYLWLTGLYKVIAMHNFCLLFLESKLARPIITWSILVGGWSAVSAITIAGPALVEEIKNGPFCMCYSTWYISPHFHQAMFCHRRHLRILVLDIAIV
jgi:hypothetical protein